MNKADLNRKIQLLEEQNEKLNKFIFEIKHTKCESCQKVHNEKMVGFRKSMRAWENQFPNYIKGY